MFDRASTFGEALDDPAARAVLERFMPGVAASPMALQFRDGRLGQMAMMVPSLEDPAEREKFWAALADLDGGRGERAPKPGPIDPDPDYEGAEVPVGSARLTFPDAVGLWEPLELRLDGPSHGNPFVDVELSAEFTRPAGAGGAERIRMGGFYDGEGVYRIRPLADAVGDWAFTTASTARSLDGISGTVRVGPAAEGAHGPVRVDGLHFRHADGTRHRPVGTTAYAWTHQPEALQQQTLATLAEAPFTKLRMCVFPKSYLYNSEEPTDFPFPGSLAAGFDLERFDAAHFRRLEQRIRDLGARGVEADLILFHPYDRWGFVDLGAAVDDRYLRHVVRRLAGFANVWWSMANEYDLVWSKEESDWERLSAIVQEEDPADHLRSIHNCRAFYDHTRPWITHASVQRQDVYRTAEFTDEYRTTWGKPVVWDEIGYEGDIDQGWGNLTAEELVRRCWEGAVRGGYVGHGETYLQGDEVLWWSKGGPLHGESAERMRFLDGLIAEAPEEVWDPLPSDWDVPWGGVAGEHIVGYFGFERPRFRQLILPEGEFDIDVIDTWAMTVTPAGRRSGTVRVDLPGLQFQAIRLRRV